MKITADTNVLVRAMTGDDEEQSTLAQAELAAAELVAVALPSLCELVWVLSQGYKIAADEIADAGPLPDQRRECRCEPSRCGSRARPAGRWRRFCRRGYCL
jgi:hypothetical protein